MSQETLNLNLSAIEKRWPKYASKIRKVLPLGAVAEEIQVPWLCGSEEPRPFTIVKDSKEVFAEPSKTKDSIVEHFNKYRKESETSVLIYSVKHYDALLNIFNANLQSGITLWHPIHYILENSWKRLRAVLGHVDLTSVFLHPGCRLYFGSKCIEEFLDDIVHHEERPLPRTLMFCKEGIRKYLEVAMHRRQQASVALSSRIPLVQPNKRNPILFITSIHTTVLQYVCQASANALNKMGHKAVILKESQPGMWLHGNEIMKAQLGGPRAIFWLDCNRTNLVSPKVPYINWVQDDLPRLMAKESIERIQDNDLTYFLTEEMRQRYQGMGYHKHTEVLPFAVDTGRFFVEKDLPRISGVGFMTNVPDEPVDEKLRKALIGFDITNDDWYKIRPLLPEISKAAAWEGSEDNLYRHIAVHCRREARVGTARYLIANGIPVSLYGAGWEMIEDLAPFAKGKIQGNALRQAYNRHSVILHVNAGVSTHSRVVEAFASGGFVVAAKSLEDGKSNILSAMPRYATQEEMLSLVERGIKDEGWRSDIVTDCRQEVLKNHTYERRMSQVIADLERVEAAYG